MDVITRQTIKGSIYSYLGAFIGFLNVVLLMPRLFTTAEIGLINILVAISAIFGQFGTLGFPNVVVKLFPYFRDKGNKHNGFVLLMLLVGITGCLLCTVFYYLFKDKIIDNNIQDSPLLVEYIYLLLPFIYITVFYSLIDVYNRVLFNASFGVFVKEFMLRILNLIGIVLFYLHVFDFNLFMLYYTLAYGVPALLICLLLIREKEFSLKPSFKLLTPEFVKQMISVTIFGLVAGAVLQIDKVLINKFYDLSATGIYSVMLFIGTMILIPGRSLMRISGAVIGESFKHSDYNKINQVYSKSVNTLSTVGMLIFILIWGNVDSILQLFKPEYTQGKYAILFISVAHLLQMFAGTSAEIINFGKYYRQFSLFMFMLVASIVVFNLLLLPAFGITGAGIALTISYLLYLFVRFLFVKKKYGFQPYNLKFLLILIFGIASYFLSSLIPDFSNYIVDIIVRSVLLCLLFIGPVYYFKLCDELNSIVDNLLKAINKRKNKD